MHVFILASKGRRRGLLSAPQYRVRGLSSSPVLLIGHVHVPALETHVLRDMLVTAFRDTCVAAGLRALMQTRLCSDVLEKYACAKYARAYRDTFAAYVFTKML